MNTKAIRNGLTDDVLKEAYLSGRTGKVVAVKHAMMPHTPVRQITYMPITDTRGIDIKVVLQPFLFHHGFQDTFSGRRTADISKADK